MENSNNGWGAGMKWTVGILVIIFAALITLAIVFDWFGWRDGEPKDQIEPITPEMVADQEVAPGASVEALPEGGLVEEIPSVREADGSVIVPENPKVWQVLGGNAVLVEEDGVKTLKFEAPMVLELNGTQLNVNAGDVITDAKVHHDYLESGIYQSTGGQQIPLTGLKMKLK